MKSDVIVIGAGAAGLMCAMRAGQRGRSVLLLDHSRKLAEKLRISGGGNCNFTNLDVRPENYLSENPHFCRSALARFAPKDFIALLDSHGIAWHEKTLGQLFCDDGSTAIVDMLRSECDAAGVRRHMGCEIEEIKYDAPDGEDEKGRFHAVTAQGEFSAPALVIATGGLSIPKIGASPFGFKVAGQFGIPVVKPRPGLVPLSMGSDDWLPFANLSGISLDVVASFGGQSFREAMLITHRGISGPAILQISSYWRHGEPLHIDLLPTVDLAAQLAENKGSKKQLSNFMAQWWPKSFADAWCGQLEGIANLPLNQYNDRQRAQIAAVAHDWRIVPTGTLGYAKAEVTCGGVDTHALSSKTMECIAVPGLYFVGEVVDVTGHLGGYNLQWAWASGHAAGEAV